MTRLKPHTELKMEATQRWKTQVIRSAAQAFKKKGYHGTSMDDIARQLNITKGNLYYYFKNKEAILFECHMACLDMAIEIIEQTQGRDMKPSERIRHWISGYLERMLQELVGSVVLMAEEGLSPKYLTHVIERRDHFERSVREIVAEGIKTNEFREGDPKIITFAILGSINWIAKWYDPNGEKSPAEIAAFFSDWIVTGLLRSSCVTPTVLETIS
jgi:AcrR family transcriptional regulator